MRPASGRSLNESTHMTKAGPLQQWNKLELDEMQKASFEGAGKDEQPVMPLDLLGPTQLPVGVRSQKIVLRHTLLEGVLQNQARSRFEGEKRA